MILAKGDMENTELKWGGGAYSQFYNGYKCF